MSNDRRIDIQEENENRLTIDGVLATQPELGPSIPDGGFGWIVFIGTLFFRALVPCLIINLGVFLAFSKLEHGTAKDKNIVLWDEKFLYVPLLFSISRIFFDSLARGLTLRTNTPRLVAVIGTCLTCAGLLFMWMGMTAKNDYWLLAPAGFLSGMGSSIVLIQCETLLAQYFRLKLPILNQISQFVSSLGFLIAPIILGHHILNTSITHVLLWYQAIILQGLIISLVFKKPDYLKSKKPNKPYQFVLSNPDDEEDILSKNSRELQIKRQISTETHVSKIAIEQPQPSSSGVKEDDLVKVEENHYSERKKWVNFEEEEEDIRYEKLDEWEVFNNDDEDDDDDKIPKKRNWEQFEDNGPPSPRIVNNLSLAEETNTRPTSNRPSPLFSDLPVNNNNTYSYDDDIITETTHTNVFMPNDNNDSNIRRHLEVLKEPSFYKSLLMMISNTYSSFIFFALYPSYLYIEAESVNIRHMTELIGALSIANLVFLSIVYWTNIHNKKRPICFWIFHWVGSIGYFMIADFTYEYLILIGGVQVILSIGALDYISRPLLKLPAKGGTSSENFLLCLFSSLSLFLFLFIDVTFQTCFRLIAVLHFFAGSLWIANFAYKRLRIR